MKLEYDYLKQNVVKIEVLKELNIGEAEAYFDEIDTLSPNIPFQLNKQKDIIIPVGTIGLFNVQPSNHWYEITLQNENEVFMFDVALEDNELNEFLKFIEVVGHNKHFVK